MELVGTPGELVMTISVTRKETGKVETFELIGTPVEDKEKDNGGNDLDSSSQRSN